MISSPTIVNSLIGHGTTRDEEFQSCISNLQPVCEGVDSHARIILCRTFDVSLSHAADSVLITSWGRRSACKTLAVTYDPGIWPFQKKDTLLSSPFIGGQYKTHSRSKV